MTDTSTRVLIDPLRALRVRLTLWYAATLFVILTILGAGLFTAVRLQYSAQLDRSLELAVMEVERAARIRQMEAESAQGAVVDAVEELRVPDRTLYLLTLDGIPVVPESVPAWVRALAPRVRSGGAVLGDHQVADERRLRYRIATIRLARGAPMLAVAVADKVELEDRYAFLITLFGAASAAALLLVAAGSWFLVRKATAPAEQSMVRMRQFMGDAAHELRTPLTALRMRAEVTLQQPRDDASYVQALRAIESESVRLGRMVDDLLLLARADAGERVMETHRVSLDDVVMEAVDAMLPMASARGLALRLDEFEETCVIGDAQMLRQLALILLHNAIKYTPSGGTVSVRVGTVLRGPYFEVSDTGVGIAAADVPRLFDRFFRGAPAELEAREAINGSDGAGLGLTIAQWIAEAHRAEIVVTSTLGEGARFVVHFPTSLPTPSGELHT